MSTLAVQNVGETQRHLHGSVTLGEHSARLLGVPGGTVIDLGLMTSTDESRADEFSAGMPDLTTRKGRKRAQRLYADQIRAARAKAGWEV